MPMLAGYSVGFQNLILEIGLKKCYLLVLRVWYYQLMINPRLADEPDMAGIRKIVEELDDDHEYSHPPSYFDNCLNTGHLMVADEGGEIVGYLAYHIVWGNTPFIELVQVPSAHQKKGIGTLLVTALEGILKSQGYSTLLSSSEVVNDMGNGFHQKAGFVSVGILDMVYGKENFYRKEII